MAEAKSGGTPGGVVSIQAIIDQITAIEAGMEAIVEAVLSSTNSILLSAKVKVAKKRLKRTADLCKELCLSVDATIKELLDTLDTQSLNENIGKLVADPQAMIAVVTGGDYAKALSDIKENAGVFELLLALVGALKLFGDADIPNPIIMMIQMTKINWSVTILNNGLAELTPQLQTLSDYKKSVDTKLLKNINEIFTTLVDVAKSISILAMMATIMPIVAPIAVLGTLILLATVRAIVWVLGMIGSKEMILQAKEKTTAVSVLVFEINHCLRQIVKMIVSFVLVLIAISLMSAVLATLFPLVLAGFVSMVVALGMMHVFLKIMTKLAAKSATLSKEFLISMLITCAVLLAVSVVVLVMALVGDMVMKNIMGVITMFGMMVVMLGAIILLMIAATAASPYIAVGVAALALVMVGLLVLLVMVGVLMLLCWAADLLNEEATIEAVNKVMRVATAVIQTILSSDFTMKEDQQDGGLIQGILMQISPNLATIFDLITKVAILFLTVLAVGVMFALTAVLVMFVDYYHKNQKAIEEAPGIISIVLAGCAEIIRTVLDANTASKMKGGDGIFITLVRFVLGDDVASILGLLFKIIIVALTMIVLVMVKFLLDELKWIYDTYTELGGAAFFKAGGTATVMIHDIMSGCSEIITTILDSGDEGGFRAGDGIYITLVKFVMGKDLGNVIALLFKVIVIAMTMVVLAMIKVVMDELKWIWDCYNELGGPQFIENVKNMVRNIIGGINSIIDIMLGGEDQSENGNPGALDKLLKWLGLKDLADVIGLMFKFIKIGMAMISLSVLLAAAKMMKEAYDAYLELGGDKIKNNMITMVSGIVSGLSGMVQSIINAKIEFPEVESEGGLFSKLGEAVIKGLLGNDALAIKKLIQKVQGISDGTYAISLMVAASRYISKCNEAIVNESKNINSSYTNINNVLNQLMRDVNRINKFNVNQDRLSKSLNNVESTMKMISETFNRLLGGFRGQAMFGSLLKQVNTYGTIVMQTDKLVTRINGLNMSKMMALAKMFGNAAAFANAINGNFDKLADVINEKIAPLIEELKNAIAEADKHAEERAKQKPVPAPQPTPAQVPAQQPGSTPAPVPGQQPGSTPVKPTKQRNPLSEAVAGGVVKVVICDRNGNPK